MSLYEIANKMVSPVEALLKALVDANYHIECAWQAGWDIDLSINPENGKVDATIQPRSAWPSPHDEDPTP